MTISALPAQPLPTDTPSVFNTKAFALLLALPTFVTEANATEANVDSLEGTATTQAGIATTQAGIATTQAGIATTQAGLATTNGAVQVALAADQVALATTQANNAATSASNALITENALKQRWLTAKAGDPALDDAGNALVAGISYFNTTLQRVRIYNGASWQDAVGAITGNFTIVRETAVATAGQSIFNLTNSYITGTNSIMVYLNGVRLLPQDYTETNTSSITLAVAANLNDELLFEIGVVQAGTTAVAGLTSFSPASGLTSTNVQAAITELQDSVTTQIADLVDDVNAQLQQATPHLFNFTQGIL